MPRRLSSIAVATSIVAALGVSGCTSSEKDSAEDFKGDQKQVAKVIDQLEDASAPRKRDSGAICTKLLTADLAKKIATIDRDTNCEERLKESLTDVKDAGGLATLKVTKVAIDGDKAVATVQAETGNAKKTSDYALVRSGNSWRIASF